MLIELMDKLFLIVHSLIRQIIFSITSSVLLSNFLELEYKFVMKLFGSHPKHTLIV